MVGFTAWKSSLPKPQRPPAAHSLLEPTGPLREAQQLAAEPFGSRQTFFVTNGTSTANKIVAQALLAGDIVLVDRNCHQSHHYGLMLAGAEVSYLDAYPLNEYSMWRSSSGRSNPNSWHSEPLASSTRSSS